jgi:hypothetical protein
MSQVVFSGSKAKFFYLLHVLWKQVITCQNLFANSLIYVGGLYIHSTLSYITTDGQSASLSWFQAPIWGL